MKHVNSVSGVILVVAGLYIVWFWGTTLISGATSLDSGAFRFVESLSQTALNLVSDNTGIIAVALAALVAGGGAMALRGRAASKQSDLHEPEKIDSLT